MRKVGTRGRTHETQRVRMLWVLEERLDVSVFYHPPGVHHRDPVAHLRDYPEVVSNQQNAHAEFMLQVAEKRKDLRLNGHVERSRGFVRDQQGRS